MSAVSDPATWAEWQNVSGVADEVVGRGAPTLVDGAGLAILDRAACLRLLADGGVGRIAINVGALPAILPVRYVLDMDRVVVRTGIDTTLDRATRGTVVAFEADGVGPTPQLMWSVSVIGVARHIRVAECPPRAELRLPRWSGTTSPRYVAISTDHLTGRQVLA